jgi:hypothetical protein
MKQIVEGDTVKSGHSERIVLKTGDWGVRVSCTDKQHSQHQLNKCYMATLWSLEQLEYNGYKLNEEREN